MSRLRACCSIQAVFGLSVQATYSIRRLPIERKDEHIDATEPYRVDGKEVAGEYRRAVHAQESAPRVAITPRCRRQPSLSEDVADRGRRDLYAEFA
jgi:hypothetical protein